MSAKKGAKKASAKKMEKPGNEKKALQKKPAEKEEKSATGGARSAGASRDPKEEKKQAMKEEKKSAAKGARSASPDRGSEKMEGKKEVKAGGKEEKVSQKTAGKKFEPVRLSPHETLEAYKIVLHPMITEKAINLIESENKLVFVVKKNANKGEIKKAVEGLYGVKVESVNVVNDSKSRKKAFVKISTQFNAGEIATRLGVL
ncbi:MAG: 50S ribosomal protein L23 [archaeon]|nr:50S ribosomal protein L23 [archaeon]